MSLFELAFHRNYCFNCKGPLQFFAYDRHHPELYKDAIIEIHDNYIRIQKPNTYEVRLGLDGHFQVYPNEEDFLGPLRHSTLNCSFLSLRKTCIKCNSDHIPANLRYLLPSFKEINNICFFELLVLFNQENKKYMTSMVKDINVVYEDEFLFIVDTMRYSTIATIKGPSFFWCESIPKIELQDFKSATDMVKFLKMIMAFS